MDRSIRLIGIILRAKLSLIKQIASEIYLTDVLDGDLAPRSLESESGADATAG